MLLSETLAIISQWQMGRRFLINYEYCSRIGLIPKNFEEKYFWSTVANNMVDGIPEKQALNLIHNCLEKYYYSNSDLWNEATTKVDGPFFRVTTLSRFLDESYPLLSLKAVLDYGYLRDDSTDEFQLRAFARDAMKPRNINPDGMITGRHPFAWASKSKRFVDAVDQINNNELSFGKEFCRLLALDGFDHGEALFLMRYPDNNIAMMARRPTACDGLGNALFKARTDLDPSSSSIQGFTVDITQIDDFDISTIPIPSYDGLPEFAVPPMPLTGDFRVVWVGFFNPAWVDCDDEVIEAIISGHLEVEIPLKSAIASICDTI